MCGVIPLRHGAPGMIRGRGLRIPEVAGIACQFATLQRTNGRVPIAESAARRVLQSQQESASRWRVVAKKGPAPGVDVQNRIWTKRHLSGVADMVGE